jgi:hypothetical protein
LDGFHTFISFELSYGFELIAPAIRVSRKDTADFVAHTSENRKFLLIRTDCMGRIIKTQVMAVQLPWEHLAGLIRVSTNRDHRLDVLFQKIVHVLGVVPGDINANLLHHLNAKRMHITRGLGTGAMNFKDIARDSAQDAFSKMAAARIAGAKNQNGWFCHFDGCLVFEEREFGFPSTALATQQQSDCRAFNFRKSSRKTGSVGRQS